MTPAAMTPRSIPAFLPLTGHLPSSNFRTGDFLSWKMKNNTCSAWSRSFLMGMRVCGKRTGEASNRRRTDSGKQT